MKNVLIIGARGYGREIHNALKSRVEYGNDFIIKGFLDDKTDALDSFCEYAPIVSSVENYVVEKDDIFVCALGSPIYRKKYVEIIKEKGGQFMTIINRLAIIAQNAFIGEGVFIGPWCNISANVEIGDFSCIQTFVVLGHDAKVGSFCEIESYSFMGGGSSIGDNVTLHTRATILPNKKVGNSAVVGAGSVVIRNIKEGKTVFGVPAKEI